MSQTQTSPPTRDTHVNRNHVQLRAVIGEFRLRSSVRGRPIWTWMRIRFRIRRRRWNGKQVAVWRRWWNGWWGGQRRGGKSQPGTFKTPEEVWNGGRERVPRLCSLRMPTFWEAALSLLPTFAVCAGQQLGEMGAVVLSPNTDPSPKVYPPIWRIWEETEVQRG